MAKKKFPHELVDDGGFTRNVLMDGIPGMEDVTPSFTGIDNVAWTPGGIPVTQDGLSPSPISPDWQSIALPASAKPVEVEEEVVEAKPLDAPKPKAQPKFVVPEAKPEPVAAIPETAKEPSSLDKLLASYNTEDKPDEELKALQEDRNRRQMLLDLIAAGTQATSGMKQVGYNPQQFDKFYGRMDQDIKDLDARRRSEKEKKQSKRDEIKFAQDLEQYDINKKKADMQMGDEKAVRDPNSEISRMSKVSIAEMLNRIGRTDQAKKITESNLSHKQLEDVYGQANIQNYITMYEAQQNRLAMEKERAAARAESKKDKEEAKDAERKEKLTTHISDKIKSVDQKVEYNKALADYEMLKQRLNSGKFDSVSDVAATYALMKALDPGSVVRESEFETLVKSQGGLAKLRQMPQRFFKGDIYSPEFRKKLVDQFSEVVGARRKQLEAILKPDLKRAKDLGLDVSHLIAPATLESFEKQGKTVTKKEYSPSKNQTRITYSDGTREIKDGRH